MTKHVVPPEHVATWAWIIGWCNFLGQTAGVSSVAYTIAQMLLACASMNSTFDNGVYSYSPYGIWPSFSPGDALTCPTVTRFRLSCFPLRFSALWASSAPLLPGFFIELFSGLHQSIVSAPCHGIPAQSVNKYPKVLASIGICIALLILTPEKQSATWVFTHVTDGSGWGSKGFSFLLGYPFL